MTLWATWQRLWAETPWWYWWILMGVNAVAQFYAYGTWGVPSHQVFGNVP
jgi:hypothetical protein